MKRVLSLFLRVVLIGILVFFVFIPIKNIREPVLTAMYEITPPKPVEIEIKPIIIGPIQQHNQKDDRVLEETSVVVELVEEPLINPYIFKLDNDGVDFSIGYMEIKFHEGLLAGQSAQFNVVSPDNLGPFETTKDALSLESKTGVIRNDNYGNLLLSLHSGYTKSERPLEAEFLRFSLEEWGKSAEYIEKKLSEIIGSSGTLVFNGHEFQIEVIGATRLQYEESEELNMSPEMVLDIVTKIVGGQYISLGNVEPFEKAKSEHRLMINFCGWGPNRQTTYYRYIILIDIKEKGTNKLTPE